MHTVTEINESYLGLSIPIYKKNQNSPKGISNHSQFKVIIIFFVSLCIKCYN